MAYELRGERCSYVFDWKYTAGAVPHAFGVYALEVGAATRTEFMTSLCVAESAMTDKGLNTLLRACQWILRRLDPVASINRCGGFINVS